MKTPDDATMVQTTRPADTDRPDLDNDGEEGSEERSSRRFRSSENWLEDAGRISDYSGEIPARVRRVRPDELVTAIAALEARRGETLVGDVTLGDALYEMRANTTLTPEEVWQEIENRRAARQEDESVRNVVSRSARQKKQRVRDLCIAAVCIVAIPLALVKFYQQAMMHQVQLEAENGQNTTNQGYYPATSLPRPAATPLVRQVPTFTTLFRRTSESVELANIPEGKPLPMSLELIREVGNAIYGTNYYRPLTEEEKRGVWLDLKMDNSSWQVERHGKDFYMYAWALPKGVSPTPAPTPPPTPYAPPHPRPNLDRLNQMRGISTTPTIPQPMPTPAPRLRLYNRPDHDSIPAGVRVEPVRVSLQGISDSGYGSSGGNRGAYVEFTNDKLVVERGVTFKPLAYPSPDQPTHFSGFVGGRLSIPRERPLPVQIISSGNGTRAVYKSR